MLDALRQYLEGFKTRLALRKAASILAWLNYEVVDTDKKTNTLAFKLEEDSVALFIADSSTLGHRIEATILFPAEILNLKLLSDISTIAYTHRCASSGAVHSGAQKAKVEVAFYLGEQFNRRDLAVGLSYIAQCVKTLGERLISKAGAVSTFKFDLSMFDDESIPFFDPQLVAERKEFMHGSWDNYIKAVANQQAVQAYSADVDHNLDVVVACREFESLNEVALVEVGDSVMMELARHRNNKAAPEDKKNIN